jgi:hypothetical protein
VSDSSGDEPTWIPPSPPSAPGSTTPPLTGIPGMDEGQTAWGAPTAPAFAQGIGLEDTGTGPLPVIRGIWFCVLMLLGSVGVWGFAWIWHTAKEVSPRVQLKPGESSMSAGTRTGFYWVPILNYVIVYQSWRDIDRFAKQSGTSGFSPGGFIAGYIILSFLSILAVLSLIFPSIVQQKLNEAWRAQEPSRATKAPMMTADWITLGIGLGIWALIAAFIALTG